MLTAGARTSQGVYPVGTTSGNTQLREFAAHHILTVTGTSLPTGKYTIHIVVSGGNIFANCPPIIAFPGQSITNPTTIRAAMIEVGV